MPDVINCDKNDNSTESVGKTIDPDYSPEDVKSPKIFLTLEKKKEIVDFWQTTPSKGTEQKRSLSAVQRRYRMITDTRQLRRFRDQVTNHENRILKCRELDSRVFTRFTTARSRGHCVKDFTIRQWGMLENRTLNLKGFKASDSWLLNLKLDTT